MKSTIDYLRDNDINISVGLMFTCRDYDYLVENNFDRIIINQGRVKSGVSVEETLNKKEILDRIKDLYFLYKLNSDNNLIREDTVRRILATG